MFCAKNTVLLVFEFKAEQTLGIHRKLEDIFSDNQTDRNIINFAFLKYSAEAVSKIALESYKQDIQSFKAESVGKQKRRKDKLQNVDQIAKSPADTQSDPQDIFSLSDRNQHLEARHFVAKKGGYTKHVKAYTALIALQDALGHTPRGAEQVRSDLDKDLKKYLSKKICRYWDDPE